jgi:hypothetical protein
MLLFTDSFDHYTTLTQKWDIVNVIGGSPSITTGSARTGLNGMQMSNTGSNVAKNIGNKVTIISGCGIKVVALPSSSPSTLIGYADSGTTQIDVRITPGGLLQLTRNGTVLATSTSVFSTGVYHYVEFKGTIDPSAGLAEVKVDGTVFATFTGNTRSTANSFAGSVYLGQFGGANGGTYNFDDFYICDSTGSFNNTYLGAIAVKCILPTANGTTNNWAIGGGSPAATNWQSVDENPPDDATTFVDSATVGQIDRYTFPAVTGSTVAAVVVNLRANISVAGTRAIRAVTKSGSTLGDNGSDLSLTTTFGDYQGIFETDPNTSAAWAVAAVNAAEWGEKVTI